LDDLSVCRIHKARSLWVVCDEAVLNLDGYCDAVPAPAFGPHMVCTRCRIIGPHARPNWQERRPQESLTGRQWN
jgi:hypothetical protein